MVKYVPAAEVVRGELLPLPPDYMPLETLAFIKCLDPDGNVQWVFRYSENMPFVECLGAIEAAGALTRMDILQAYSPYDHDHDHNEDGD